MFWFSALYCLCTILVVVSGRCSINLETPLGGRTPVVLQNGYILTPDNRDGDVVLQDYDRVQFLCSGRNNFLISRQYGSLANATCINNQFRLDSNGMSYNFVNLQCRTAPQAQTSDVGLCNLQSKKIHIGFQVDPTKFLSMIELCFDDQRLTTYWSKHFLRNSPYSCQTADTTAFKKDFFPRTVNPDSVYGNVGQTIDKGHLSPKCDFFTGPEKRMTFYYINASPQHKDFNRKNWRDLEGVIRTAASTSNKLLYIYTGTAHTVQTLSGSIPMSLYFWKVVIEHTTGEGVAFVGINDVQQNVASPCQQIQCSRLNWLSRTFITRMSDIAKGQIYCCTIQSLQNMQNWELPQFSEFQGGLLRSL